MDLASPSIAEEGDFPVSFTGDWIAFSLKCLFRSVRYGGVKALLPDQDEYP